MRKFINILLILICLSATTYAQTNDNILFKAMEDEMKRAEKDLKLPGAPPIYFISCTVSENRYVSITSSKGSVVYVKESPKERMHSINLYVGNSKLSSDYSYSGNGMVSQQFTTSDDNYDQLRRNFWQTYDLAYKFAVEVYNSKKNNLKTANLSDEEKALEDITSLKKIEVYAPHFEQYTLDKKTLSDLADKISLKISEVKGIFDAKAEIDGIENVYYYVSNEGTKVKEPVAYIRITMSAKTRNSKKQVVKDKRVFYAKSTQKLPTEAELLSMASSFANDLSSMYDINSVDEYYLGPVLFVEEAAGAVFAENIAGQSGVLSFRKPIQVMATVARPENVGNMKNIKPLEERIGKKVVDSRISVMNITSNIKFGGNELLGSYLYDAQGVKAKDSVILIQNGILKTLLSTRVPTLKIKESTGSLRFGVKPRAISLAQAPGNLVIKSASTANCDSLKRMLIASAKEEGLDYCYIVKKIAAYDEIKLVKVNVADGSEKIVTGAEIGVIPFTKLKRVLGVSAEQSLFNYLFNDEIPVSVVHPKGILIEDVEIDKKPLSVQKESKLIVN